MIRNSVVQYVQGDPNQNLLIQMGIPLKICILSFFYPYGQCKLILKIVSKLLKNEYKKPRLSKHILALPELHIFRVKPI